MKNKKLLYILIPATLIIWGLVAWNIVSHVSGKNEITEPQFRIPALADSDTLNEGYELLINYSDPFLTTRRSVVPKPVQKNTNTGIRSNQRTHPPQTRPRRVVWPGITYLGTVESKRAEVALLQIDRINYLMQEGDVIKEVELLKIYNDSVQLSFQAEGRTIVLSGKNLY